MNILETLYFQPYRGTYQDCSRNAIISHIVLLFKIHPHNPNIIIEIHDSNYASIPLVYNLCMELTSV